MVMGLQLLTKIARNGYANAVSPRSVFPSSSSSFLKNTFHQRSIISEYSMISPSHLQKICSPNGVVSGAMVKKGVFSNPKLVAGTRFFSNALWKGRSSIPLTIRNSRFYNSFRSLDSGRKSFFKRFSTHGATIGLIVTNVAVFLLWRVADNDFMVKNFMISLENFKSGRLHTLVTSGFTHCDTLHFVTNMIGLCLFGPSIGRSFGQRYLLMLYLSGAIAGSISNLGLCSRIDSLLKNDQGVSYSKFPLQIDQGVSYSKIPLQSAIGAMDPIVNVGICQIFIKIPSLVTFLPRGIFATYFAISEYLMLLEGNSFAIFGGTVVSSVVCYKYLKVAALRLLRG